LQPSAEPRQAEQNTFNILTPELRTRDGLKSLISLGALTVLDVPNDDLAMLGFSFGCSWDVEHGLCVLVRGGEVIEVGDNSITWNASEFADQPSSLRPLTQQEIDEQNSIAAMKRLGGSEQYDRTESDAPVVVEVELLRNNRVTDADLMTVLKHLPRLRQVRLASTEVTDAGLKVLQHLRELRVLELTDAAITDVGLRELREFENLELLYLSGTKVTDTGLKELRAHHALVSLRLNGTDVADAGLNEIGAITSLKYLELSGTQITDAGILKLKDLPSLLFLNLQATLVSDVGIVTLSEFKRLRDLNLSGTRVTDKGLERLKELRALRSLKLASTAVTEAGVTNLLRSLTVVQVIR